MNEIITERCPLGEVDQSRCDELAKEQGRKPSELEFIRKGFVINSKGTDDEERSSTELISTSDIDRDNEILLPKGAILTHYKKNPQVLWAHDYGTPPIGRAAWIKKDASSKGLLAKTIYATTAFAEEIWTLVKGGFLPARSVGFIPIESHEPDDKEIARNPGRAGARRVYDKWEMLEYSVVPVPSNRQALQQAVGKDISLSMELQSQLGLEEKAEYSCECIKCGHKLTSDKHCKDLKCPECGGRMRRVERPGPGQEGFEIDYSKPYPQEHACRLKSPSLFQDDSFRRTTRKHDGKEYSIISGRLKGETTMTEQAYRYSKDDWSAAQARSHCKEHEGTFEAAKQEAKVISLPSKVKEIIYVPKVKRVVFVPKKKIDMQEKIAIVVSQEINRLRGRI